MNEADAAGTQGLQDRMAPNAVRCISNLLGMVRTMLFWDDSMHSMLPEAKRFMEANACNRGHELYTYQGVRRATPPCMDAPGCLLQKGGGAARAAAQPRAAPSLLSPGHRPR